MTAKRFNYVAFDGFEDNGEYITPYQVVDLLNKQHKTIQRLKENIDELLSVNVEEELLKENEELKGALKELKEIGDYQAKRINELSDENEQLKQEKESLIKGIKDTAKQGADTITAVWESKNRPTTMNKGYYDR